MKRPAKQLQQKQYRTISAAIAAGLLVVGAVACLAVIQHSQRTSRPVRNDSSVAAFQKEYPLVAADTRFVPISGEDAVDIFKTGTAMIFLGFEECPWCQQLAPIVDEAAKDEGLDTVYYVDIRQAREENDETYQQLVAVLEPRLRKDDDGQPRIYVPDVSTIKDGKIVGHFIQESAGDKQVTAETFWTSERRVRAVEQLRTMIADMR